MLTGDPQGLAREELEDPRRSLDLGDAFRARLALLAREELAELVGARGELGPDELQCREPLGGRSRGPAPLRGQRRLDGVIDLTRVADRELADDVGAIRGVHVGGRRRAVDGDATDEVRIRHGRPLWQVRSIDRG